MNLSKSLTCVECESFNSETLKCQNVSRHGGRVYGSTPACVLFAGIVATSRPTKAVAAAEARRPSRTDVLRVVGLALVCEKTAAKALTDGPDAVAGVAGDRCRDAMRTLGLEPTKKDAAS